MGNKKGAYNPQENRKWTFCGTGQSNKYKACQCQVSTYRKLQCEQKSPGTWKSEGDSNNINLNNNRENMESE